MPKAEGGSLYEGRWEDAVFSEKQGISIPLGRAIILTSHIQRTKYTIRYSEYFRTWAPDRRGALFQIPCPEFQQQNLQQSGICFGLSSSLPPSPSSLPLSLTQATLYNWLSSFIHSVPGTGDRNINKMLSQGAHSLIGETNISR